MELFLNLLWVALAVSVTAVWRMAWAHQSRRVRHTTAQQGVALGCAFLFLFFYVSLSDDLHSEIIVLEDAGRRHSVALTSPGQTANVPAAIKAVCAAILPCPGASAALCQTDPLESLPELPSPAFERLCAHGLSPPANREI